MKGILTVLSGFSGAGKGTLMKHLLKTHPGEYSLSVSATTREKRPGEEEGREYFFKSRREFDRMVERGEFLEHATFNGNSYGTPRFYVDEMIAKGRDIILEIEVQGALQVKEIYPEALLLFVSPPSAQELKNRLFGRGTEDADTIAKRLAISVKESAIMDRYDYIIVNDVVDTASERIHSIIQSEHAAAKRSGDFIEEIRKDLKAFEL